MTAYLVWRGMRLETVGVWRGVSSAIGLAGTFVYYCSARRLTVVETGMWSICYQLAFITVSFGALFVSDYRASMALLIVGVCASRIGLWAFDIAVCQLMQEHIPDGIRGVVGGTQQALNAFFQLLSYALGIVFPDPSEFNVYVAAGYVAVVIGCLLYTLGVYRNAGDFPILQHG
jgi:solute carrier family 40 (iron-regulated transporter), member 1